MKAVLNVGGGANRNLLPGHYAGWRQDLLDIDPEVKPDVLMDARELLSATPAAYDAIFCSHNLEHYHRADCVKVIRGFDHVLAPGGFIEIWVPDFDAVVRHIVQRNLDIDDVLRDSPVGPILVRDVIYGFHKEIERSGNDFYCHKTAFTKKSLETLLRSNGFGFSGVGSHDYCQLFGYFFKQMPTPEQLQMLKLCLPSPQQA